MNPIATLEELRASVSKGQHSKGLSLKTIEGFLRIDPKLAEAIELAKKEAECLASGHGDWLQLEEDKQIEMLQADYVNFYATDSINPYVALAARGPWIVTSKGAVLYDAGGYGMLGMGHCPPDVLKTMSVPHVMANIMTPSFTHKRFANTLRQHIGFTRPQALRHPFAKFLCMNSGSESMSVAARISDINAALLTAPGARHAGKSIKWLAFKGGFHGRTDRPAEASDSSMPKYKKHLASFQNRDNLVTIRPNHIEDLRQVFQQAQKDRVFFESFFVEPVMGEGNPGVPLDVEFYKVARQLTADNGTLLVCDSIQAGIRANGCLSICDYPGFENLAGPDMETYSKAINAGHYPLSVLAMNENTAAMYVKGVYGNTMTANPKALEVAITVLERLTPELRKNIVDRGREFVQQLKELQTKYPSIIIGVQGTGLLVSAAIAEDRFEVVGVHGLEEQMRRAGINVIHGGKNALRFTPHFAISSQEIKLVIEVLDGLLSGVGK
jgi:acetylornithine/succinyldiaminopimelate/putrescine aminotransferase